MENSIIEADTNRAIVKNTLNEISYWNSRLITKELVGSQSLKDMMMLGKLIRALIKSGINEIEAMVFRSNV